MSAAATSRAAPTRQYRHTTARLALLSTVLLLALAAASFPVTSAYAEAPVITEYSVDAPPDLKIGERFKVTIIVETDTGTRVEIAPGGIPQDLALAESARFKSSDKGSGRVEVRIDLVLSAFLLGDYAMPPITLRYRDAGGASGDLKTPSSRLIITSTLPGGATLPEPRDLKPQAEIRSLSSAPYELVAAAGAAFVLAVVLLYIAWRRMQTPIGETLPAPALEAEVLGPEDGARRLLDAAGASFAAGGAAADYYSSISRAVRGYLTERYGFPAFALTTVELQNQMVFRGMDRWQARLVAGLLEQCDAVMYARYAPALERADADLTAAYEIIEMSRPHEEPQEVAGA